MNKANLVIKGNLVYKDIITTGGGSQNDVICFANLDDFDISEAVIIEDNLVINSTICCNGLVLITGDNKTYIGSIYTHN